MYVFIPLFVCLLILCLVLFHFRKKKVLHKLCCLTPCEKYRMLNELTEPFGYWYDSDQDIFSSRTDAWQKTFGYGQFYDNMAPFFNMIFDCQPVYFDYGGKTWLIEFWKGQYGINTGSEAGVYHCDTILAPSERKTALFRAVEEEDYLNISTRLCRRGRVLSHLSMPHWWLTMFSMGCFSRPKDLTLEVSLHFPDFEMLDAFVDALLDTGYDPREISLSVRYLDVSFTFHTPKKRYSLLRRIHRCIVQWKNFIFCKLYCFVTRPCSLTCDKLLYLYFYLPFTFRRMFRLRRCRRRRPR